MKTFFLDQHTVRGNHIVIILVGFRGKVTIVDSMIPFILKFLDINGRNSCTVTNDSIQDIKYIAIDNVVKRVTFLGVKRYKG